MRTEILPKLYMC